MKITYTCPSCGRTIDKENGEILVHMFSHTHICNFECVYCGHEDRETKFQKVSV